MRQNKQDQQDQAQDLDCEEAIPLRFPERNPETGTRDCEAFALIPEDIALNL